MSSEAVNYQEIHAYMIRKTREYYLDPPAPLVEAVIRAYKAQGEEISYEEAKPLVSLINIQRYLKQESVRTAQDLERKYNLAELTKNVKLHSSAINKTNSRFMGYLPRPARTHNPRGPPASGLLR